MELVSLEILYVYGYIILRHQTEYELVPLKDKRLGAYTSL